MSRRETYRNVLTYALTIAGGERRLANRLGVAVQQIEDWHNGVDEIPERVFLALVDVVADATPDEISRSRVQLTRHPR